MRSRPFAALSVLLLVVLAGCGGLSGPVDPTATDGPAAGTAMPTDAPPTSATPTATPTPTAAPTSTATATPTPTATPTATATTDPAEKVTVEGGDLSFDVAAVYERVLRLHGRSVADAPAVTVTVEDTAERGGPADPGRFDSLLGFEPVSPDTAVAGLAQGNDVWVYTDVVTEPTDQERVLAHEFAHVLQFEADAQARVLSNLDPYGNVRVLTTAVVEGAATYVEGRYAADHLGGDDEPPSWATVRANRTQLGAWAVAPYVFGQRYVHERVDSVEDLEAVYDDPPQTTEQLIHGYAPDEQLPSDLVVRVDDSDWYRAAAETRGELYLRVALEGELSLDRAADAAAGWDNDELVTVRNGDADHGFVWALGWDDPGEADEFEAAMRAFLDGHAEADGDGWRTDDGAFRLVRVDDETVVLVAGDETFVESAVVGGEDGDVTVSVGA